VRAGLNLKKPEAEKVSGFYFSGMKFFFAISFLMQPAN
jgi:hypothetical protein